jgi:hypothetical protein
VKLHRLSLTEALRNQLGWRAFPLSVGQYSF